MAVQIRIRRDTTANWALANPVLADGEPALDTDEDRIKYGDGVTPWLGLAWSDAAAIATAVASKVDKAVPALAPPTRLHSFNPALSLYNEESKWMRKLRNEVAASQLGARRVQAVLLGHSYLAGSNAVPGTSDVGTLLRQYLRHRLGSSRVPTPYSQFRNGEARDSHYSAVSAGWGLSNGAQTTLFGSSTAAGDELTYTSTETGTIVDIITFDNSATFTYSIDGATAVTVTALSSTANVRRIAISGLANTTHTVKIVASAASAYLISIGVRNATHGLEIFNGGYGGSYAADWTSVSATVKRGTLTSAAYERTIAVIQMDTNDVRTATTVASWKTSMQTILTSHVGLNHASLLVMSVNTDNAGAITPARWAEFYAAGYELADQYDIPLLDTTHLLNGWTSVVADGLQGDALHLNTTGQSRVASKLAEVFTS